MRPRVLGALLLVALAAVVLGVMVVVLRPSPLPSPAPVTRGGVGTPLTMEEFKLGLGCHESDGDYDARNPRSNAIGKYQMLPTSWRDWARRWLGDGRAEPTPENQELVSTKKLAELRRNLGSWVRVAYWWFTGREDTDRSRWTDFANGYVESVLHWARASQTASGRELIPVSCFSTPQDPHPVTRPPLSAAPDPTPAASAAPASPASPKGSGPSRSPRPSP